MTKNDKKRNKWSPEKSEEAMIQGIIEGSPNAIGVAVDRSNSEPRKNHLSRMNRISPGQKRGRYGKAHFNPSMAPLFCVSGGLQ